jgi:hypothetical protein
MAIAKKITVGLELAEDNLVSGLSSFIDETSADGADANTAPQDVGTSWEALDIGACSPADWVLVKNIDATNFVQLATSNGGTGIFAKIAPGRAAIFPAEPTATYYVKADTAACRALVVVVEA